VRRVLNRLENLIEIVQSPEFAKLARLKPQFFTRNRKMGLSCLVLQMLSNKGLTLSVELMNFFSSIPNCRVQSMSKVAYLKQRQHLNPRSLEYLIEQNNCDYYQTEDLKKFRNHLVLAVDGSDVNIPTNSETLEVFGNASSPKGRAQAALTLSCLHDVLNNRFLSWSVNKYKIDERTQVSPHLSHAENLLNTQKYILTLDRGYPSIHFFMELIDANIPFVVRLPLNHFKDEFKSMQTDDQTVSVRLTNNRKNNHKGTEQEMLLESRGDFEIRLVTVELENSIEHLATNLPIDTFDTYSIKELYGMRWGIETQYDVLKNKLQLENFTSFNPSLIKQDILIVLLLSNITTDITNYAEKEIVQKHKHPHKPNMAIAVGLIKERLINFVLQGHFQRIRLLQQLLKTIASQTIPIRKGRRNSRNTSAKKARFFQTKKRTF
jgi:hypothetical protein